MKCNICNSTTELLFTKKILGKYEAEYFQCKECDFIQVKNPHWLHEAYESAISSLDTGLVSRNLYFSPITEKLLLKYFDYHKRFIDYGGGYGLFVRLMRDKGFDFYRQDPYCQNLFALYFDVSDLKEVTEKFELLTAFELFEHLEHPITEIERMLTLSDSILFSTELQPDNIKNHEDWWYFSPESGQHISFYTKKSLESIAEHFGLTLHTNNTTLHLLTKKHFNKSPFETRFHALTPKIQRKALSLMMRAHFFVSRMQRKARSLISSRTESRRLKSLTQEDSKFIKEKLKKKT
ncbi:MAG: class I SAM-dependent methyltransferase [Minisyncoccota bacterium]